MSDLVVHLSPTYSNLYSFRVTDGPRRATYYVQIIISYTYSCERPQSCSHSSRPFLAAHSSSSNALQPVLDPSVYLVLLCIKLDL